ncbi:MAG: twitching motility protein [Firmicutes bacterium]|nr:twitching motility protein [Bacillota bacterium]
MKSIQEMLSVVAKKNGSDLHLITNVVPTMRINGEIETLGENMPVMEAGDSNKLVAEILNAYQLQQLGQRGDADAAYSCESTLENKILRARVNIFKDHRGISFAFRLINNSILTMQELMLPYSLRNLVNKEHGFIVITGPTGSGKTTTLASMIDHINETKYRKIITLEDPIEYVYSVKRSIISQREIGKDCMNFADGLKAALRQDPDVILAGEMRDPETIATALTAAETGHLVITTLHTGNVIEAIDRILQYFPAVQQKQVQTELANCFLGIVAQKLISKKDGNGRVAAFEVLLKTPATEKLIRTGEAFQLKDYMRAEYGMLTMDESIKSLRQRQLIV